MGLQAKLLFTPLRCFGFSRSMAVVSAPESSWSRLPLSITGHVLDQVNRVQRSKMRTAGTCTNRCSHPHGVEVQKVGGSGGSKLQISKIY
jgi:hypothetical protein